jgi:outer membrane immunogenic protein
MRRQILLASVGALALTGSAAFAADLPYRGPPPVYLPPPPIFTWTGLYIGGQIGYAWARDNVNLAGISTDPLEATEAGLPGEPDGDEGFITSFSSRPHGVIGGAHLGYNLQFGQWVAGVEGSVDGTSLDDIVSFAGVPTLPGLTVQSREDVQGSIRGRLGIAFDRVLLYATGGAAFSNVKNDYKLGAPMFLSESITKTRTGWTVGGGLAYAITNNWSIGAEYRYSDFGRYDDFPFGILASVPNARHHLTENQVQARFSYKFDWGPPPVVAKY